MTLPPFTTIRARRKVLRYLGQQPAAVAYCLRQAFRNIRLRQLSLNPPGGRNAPFSTAACMHRIYVSINVQQDTVVVVGVVYDASVGP